jgi:hypothetical protein
LGDFPAIITLSARLDPLWGRAVQSLGKNTRKRSFTDSSRSDKQISVSNASRLYRMTQSPYHMFLTDDVIKRHRTVLERKRYMLFLGHRIKNKSIVSG